MNPEGTGRTRGNSPRKSTTRVRNGGLFVTDNVLWSGKVAESESADASTKAIVEFNRLLYSSPEFFTTIIPLRDGVAVAQRNDE